MLEYRGVLIREPGANTSYDVYRLWFNPNTDHVSTINLRDWKETKYREVFRGRLSEAWDAWLKILDDHRCPNWTPSNFAHFLAGWCQANRMAERSKVLG